FFCCQPDVGVRDLYFFFFQAEDGIRDRNVTGVQTCALPILEGAAEGVEHRFWHKHAVRVHGDAGREGERVHFGKICRNVRLGERSEERRVGKERRTWRSEERGVGKEGEGRGRRQGWTRHT